MKQLNNTRYSHVPSYPNEADPGYFSQRLLDGITSAITGMGVLAIFVFLITL